MEKQFIKLYTNDLKGKGLTITDKAVYSSLHTKYQYHENKPFYTYEKFIAEELEVSERSVRNSIKKLEESGLVEIKRQYNKETRKTTNFYIVKDTDTAEANNKESMEITNTQTPINEDMTIEELDTVFDIDNADEPVYLPLNFNNYDDEEDINNNSDDITDYQKMRLGIMEKYNKSPEEYLENINKILDIDYKLLEELADMSNSNPEVALKFIKDIRNIA